MSMGRIKDLTPACLFEFAEAGRPALSKKGEGGVVRGNVMFMFHVKQ